MTISIRLGDPQSDLPPHDSAIAIAQQHVFTAELVLSCGLAVTEAFVQVTGLSIAGEHVTIDYAIWADPTAPLNGLGPAEKRTSSIPIAALPEAVAFRAAAEARLKPLLEQESDQPIGCCG